MKRNLLGLIVLLLSSAIFAAGSMPVSLPNIGDGRLKVCAQNTKNYYVVDLSASRPDYHDQAGLVEKTNRMVRSLRYIDADIYALCELEVKDSVLSYLTNAMNKDAGEPIYQYVKDGLSADGTYIKSGFIYRIDKVKPFGANTAGSTEQYYRNTMRIQAFEELSTGERFVLSMNHFKAQDSSEDAGESKRQKNAENLVSALAKQTQDPDQLVMGDFNCDVTTAPLQYLMANANLEEQLLRFDKNAYSYMYYGRQLIDHAFANPSMAEQITGAGVFHISTGVDKKGTYYYTDHDAVLVALNLYHEDASCIDLNEVQDFKTGLGGFTDVRVSGSSYWKSDTNYGAVINGYNREGKQENWLISPSYNLSGAQDATITIEHNIYYHNGDDYKEKQTLWVSTNYINGDPNSADWQQVEISDYAVKSYVKSVSAVPESYRRENFHYALRYEATGGSNGNYWEVKSATLSSRCTQTDFVETEDTTTENVKKVYREGRGIVIIVDGVEYDILGLRIE